MTKANGLRCPVCGGIGWSVTNTYKEPGRVRRRRVCKSCGTRWNTRELNSGGISVGQLEKEVAIVPIAP